MLGLTMRGKREKNRVEAKLE